MRMFMRMLFLERGSFMKVRANIMLDEDVKRDAIEELGKLGMSLSGFINGVLAQFVVMVRDKSMMVPDKAVKDLTLDELSRLVSLFASRASG